MNNQNMLYDERGRPYFLMPDGSRNYVSPAAMGEPPPPDDTGLFHRRPEWNQQRGEYETPFDWGNLVNLGVGGALGASALSAAGLFGGGASAGGGTGIATANSAAGLPTAGMTAGLIGGTAPPVAAGLGSRLLGAIPGLAIGALGRLTSRAGGGRIPPELQQVLDLQKRRMAFQNPLFEAISRLAMSRLPIAQQQPLPRETSTDPRAALQRLATQRGQG